MTATLEAPAFTITEEQKRQFREHGYFILERVIPEEQLAIIREECRLGIEDIHKEMDKQGKDTLFISHRNSRYFIPWRTRTRRPLWDFAYGAIFAEICRATIGENAFFFLDQFVVKAAERGMKFSWHQDSGYVPWDHPPYLTCWTTLDDVSEKNGTVYILPTSTLGIRSRVTHVAEPGTNDMIGYYGSNPGIPIIAPAGSIAVFSSITFHRSGMNQTNQMRRVYLTQYTSTPLMNPFTNKPLSDAAQFLKDGERVAQWGETAPGN